jgi:hypothetical protein
MLVLSELLMIALLIGLALWPVYISLRLGIVLFVLLFLSLIPVKNTNASLGKLSPNRVLFVASFLIALGSIGVEPLYRPQGLALLVPGGGFAILGIIRTIKDLRTKTPWTAFRSDMAIAVLATLVGSMLVVGMSMFALRYLSELPITPGKHDFIFIMLFWAATWFGLDGHLRELGSTPITNFRRWFIEQRHSLMLIGVCVVLICS